MYPIAFSKTKNNDYRNPLYQDRITPDIWLTRRSRGGPLFNYKPYENTELTELELGNELYADIWNDDEPGWQGGTVGLKWAILSAQGFPEVEESSVNPNLLGTIGNPTNFYNFAQMMSLLLSMMGDATKPVSLVPNSRSWVLEDGREYGNMYRHILRIKI
jgi:hypothetical protein